MFHFKFYIYDIIFFSLVFLKNTVGFNWVGYITFLALYATFEFGLKNEPDIFKVEIV